jgi:hypothetical protein
MSRADDTDYGDLEPDEASLPDDELEDVEPGDLPLVDWDES